MVGKAKQLRSVTAHVGTLSSYGRVEVRSSGLYIPCLLGVSRSPVTSSTVGTKSMTVQDASVMTLLAGWLPVVELVTVVGGFTTRGTRQSPSVESILNNLLGAVASWAQRQPYQTKESPLPMF